MATARHLSPTLFLVLLLVSLGYVLWRGETAERACVLAIAITSVLSVFVASRHGMWLHNETGIFIVDVSLLVAFVIIMASSNRFWPLWMTAIQIVAVMTFIARFLKPNTVPLAYAIAEQFWVLPMQAILVSVVWRRHRSKPPTRLEV